MGAVTSALGSIDPTGSGDQINKSVNRDIISGDPEIAKQRDRDRARLDELSRMSGDETLQKYGRTIDTNAFAPVFGGTAQALDQRSTDAAAMGGRQMLTGSNAMVRAGSNIERVDLGGLANAANRQGTTADLLTRQYEGGTDPSAAQAQLQAGTDQALRAQLAAARSSGNPAAGYQAQLTGALTQQQAANQAAQLRAQESQAARSDMLAAQGAATGAQGTVVDARIGQQQAAAGVGANVAQLGAGQQARADSLTGQAAQLREADRGSAQNLEQMKSQELSGARAYQSGLSGALMGTTQAKQQAESERMQRATGLTGNIIGGIAQAFVGSDTRSKTKIKELKAENAVLKGTASEAETQKYLDDLDLPELRGPMSESEFLSSHDDAAPMRPAYDAAQTSDGLYDPWGEQAPRRAPPPSSDYGYAFAPLSGPWATSDERAKDVHDMYRASEPIEFEYRDGYGPPGPRAGTTAQSLERTRLGRSLVGRDPDTGMRVVDTPQLTMANTAEIALLRDELDAMKGGRRGR